MSACLIAFAVLIYGILRSGTKLTNNKPTTCNYNYVHGYNCRRLCHLHPYPFCLHYVCTTTIVFAQCLQRDLSIYIIGTLLMQLAQRYSFLLFMMIIHDLISRIGKYILQSDGHGILISNIGQYKAIWISTKVNTAINKIAQIVMLAIYLLSKVIRFLARTATSY